MYQIRCNEYVLYDPRDDELIVNSPKCKLQVNTVGEASFSIYATHPYYEHLEKMKSVIEILQDGVPIFRGRITDDTKDFNNIKVVDVEGVMAYFNDSIIRPFAFPEDFVGNSDYQTAATSGNVVEYFLDWLISQHNSQVRDFQQFKLGKVTVTDVNNYLSRSSTDYSKTWEVLKSKLFDSSLAGYLCIRYEVDGNYIDYLEDFELTNIQKVSFGENLLNISSNSDASERYSAVIPLGKKIKEIDETSDDESRLTIESLEDGDISDDIVKSGDTLYSKSAVDEFGWIYAPPSDTVWDDVTVAVNLQEKGMEYLTGTATKLKNTIEIQALDLHYSDADIEAFRIYKYIVAISKAHNLEGKYKLTALDIDILNPQNTKITLGETKLSMTDINSGIKQNVAETVQIAGSKIYAEAKKIIEESSSSIIIDCEKIVATTIENMGNKVLWSSNIGYHMSDAQVINLAEPISKQLTGIVFVWSWYNTEKSEPGDTEFHYFFVPKYHVAVFSGKNVTMSDFCVGVKKLVYISDSQITGCAENSTQGTDALTGLSYDNRRLVLRAVVGV